MCNGSVYKIRRPETTRNMMYSAAFIHALPHDESNFDSRHLCKSSFIIGETFHLSEAASVEVTQNIRITLNM